MEGIGEAVEARQVALAMQIQAAVARKRLDAMASEGEAVKRLLDASTRMSKAQGRGGIFDAVG